MKKILIAILTTTILSGCSQRSKTAEATNSYKNIEIDTIFIHGKKHEVLFWYYSYKGGMMHSPECWCENDSAQWK